MSDRFDAARAVADAVLFEGYVLYPYRASAPKNQVRWQWGVLFPRVFAEADGSERWRNRTECIVDPGSSPRLTVHVRGLHVQHRSVEVDGAPVTEVQVDGVPWVPWDEAVEWELDLPAVPLLPLQEATYEERVVLAGGDERESLRSADGAECGVLVRRREPIDVVVHVGAEWAAGAGALVKATVTVENASAEAADEPTARRRPPARARGRARPARCRRRRLRLVARPRRRGGRRGGGVRRRRHVPGARGRRRPGDVGGPDHPVRPPRDRARERRRSVRRHRDRRDPRPARADPDRRREGRGPCHRPPRGRNRGPHRRHGARDLRAPARHAPGAAPGARRGRRRGRAVVGTRGRRGGRPLDRYPPRRRRRSRRREPRAAPAVAPRRRARHVPAATWWPPSPVSSTTSTTSSTSR